MTDGIIFVGMTLSTSCGSSHPGRHSRIDTINDRCVTKFFITRSAFVIRLSIAVESSGNELIFSWGGN